MLFVLSALCRTKKTEASVVFLLSVPCFRKYFEKMLNISVLTSYCSGMAAAGGFPSVVCAETSIPIRKQTNQQRMQATRSHLCLSLSDRPVSSMGMRATSCIVVCILGRILCKRTLCFSVVGCGFFERLVKTAVQEDGSLPPEF